MIKKRRREIDSPNVVGIDTPLLEVIALGGNGKILVAPRGHRLMPRGRGDPRARHVEVMATNVPEEKKSNCVAKKIGEKKGEEEREGGAQGSGSLPRGRGERRCF